MGGRLVPDCLDGHTCSCQLSFHAVQAVWNHDEEVQAEQAQEEAPEDDGRASQAVLREAREVKSKRKQSNCQ